MRENGAHSDCLQTVWVGDHIVFRKNYLHDNRCQGFFVKDQASLGGVSGPIHGIRVEDNLFLRNHEPCGAPLGPNECGQPLYFQVAGPYTGFVMKNNTIWGDTVDSIAAFREGTGPDTLIEDNVIYRLWTDTDMGPATLRNNTICEREAAEGGSWPTPTGETVDCDLHFPNTAADDYRLGNGRGVDWAPGRRALRALNPCSLVVYSVMAVHAALAPAPPGKVICLGNGHYGKLSSRPRSGRPGSPYAPRIPARRRSTAPSSAAPT